MLVFWKEKLVVLAVPKTGTTAIEGVLAPRASMVLRDPPDIKHAPLHRYRRFLEPFFTKAGAASMETVAVIREPIDWLGSWYRYRRREGLEGHPNSTRGIAFDDFVQDYCRETPPAHAAVGAQSRFIIDRQGLGAVDHLFRYENRPALLAFLEERLGGPIDLDRRRNVSPAMPLELSPETETRLRREKPEDFAAWELAT